MNAKALALCGSPRPNGNTAVYLEAALSVLSDCGVQTELLTLHDKTIGSCRACYECWRTGRGVCQMAGDDFHDLYPKMVAADALLVGSAVHYSAVYPELWSLLVRAGFPGMVGHPHSPPRPFSRKVGGPVTVARRAGHNFAFAQLLLWFHINEFVVPGSIYWTVGVARSVGDAEEDREGIMTAQRFGENVAWLLARVAT